MKLKTRLLPLFFTAVLAGALNACGSGESESRVVGSSGTSEEAEPETSEPSEPEASASDFEVVSGFTAGQDSIGTQYTSAGARLTNPNAELAAYDVQVLFNLLSASGEVLDSSTETVSYIGPGESVPVAPLQIGFEVKEVPTDLQVQVVGEFVEDEGPKGTFGTKGAILDFIGGELTRGDYGSELTAQVSNPTDVVVEYPSWSCIYVQGDKIVGGASSTIIDPIPPGTTVQFGETLTLEEIKASSVECRVAADL